ncbi:MAG: glycosyltransferase family 39 protein [candidate division Zixibacteria bacterium]|nr:glycosyltransferase family 39 protein [candidate division Zixibacteria bacterium]
MPIFFRKYYREILLSILAIALLAPLMYYGRPLYLLTPDIKYAKAKVLQISLADPYADPVTGYDTFHPPYYYLVLAALTATGLDFNTVLFLITILNVSLILFLAYAVLRTIFGATTAFLACLMIPFIIQFMGCRNILLPTSFCFSVPFYLAGLWCYLEPNASPRQSTLAAVLWGLAFLISPVYLFLLGLTFLMGFIKGKERRRSLLMAVAFLITIIPFYIQGAVIFSQHLWGTSTFAFWRGIPDYAWFHDLMVEFISPVIYARISVPTVIHVLILLLAAVLMVKTRRVHWYLPLSLTAYLLTYYHFSAQYAIRIQVFFSLFLVAATIDSLRGFVRSPLVWAGPIIAAAVYALVFYYDVTIPDFQYEQSIIEKNRDTAAELWNNVDKYLDKGGYVFCTKQTYFDALAPVIPVHALGAYKTMDYFQLNSRLAEELDADYTTAIFTHSYDSIQQIAAKYGIGRAVMMGGDVTLPGFQLLMQNWKRVYQDKYFLILQRPD